MLDIPCLIDPFSQIYLHFTGQIFCFQMNSCLNICDAEFSSHKSFCMAQSIEKFLCFPSGKNSFRSPLVSFLYERGWRQNFNRSGFPGPDEEVCCQCTFYYFQGLL